MDRNDLSSNWRQLQAKLTHEKRSDRGHSSVPKRRIGSSTNAIQGRPEKRFKPAIWKPAPRPPEKADVKRPSPRALDAKHGKMIEVSNSLGSSMPAPDKPDRSTTSTHLSYPKFVPVDDLQSQTLGKYISLDTEMVGTPAAAANSLAPHYIGTNGHRNDFSILARVSLVSHEMSTVYDAFVLPPMDTHISDYRTKYSGITPWHLKPGNKTTNPKPFAEVQARVAELIDGRVLVGHALSGDLKVLGLTHPRARIRDTSRHPKYRTLYSRGLIPSSPADNGDAERPRPTAGPEAIVKGKGRTPSLKMLASSVLGWDIQGDEVKGHSSVEDAKAAMALFKAERTGFEEEAKRVFGQAASAAVNVKQRLGRTEAKESLKSNTDPDGEMEGDDADLEVDEDSVGGYEDEKGRVVGERRVMLQRVNGTDEPDGVRRESKTKRKKKKKKGRYRRA